MVQPGKIDGSWSLDWGVVDSVPNQPGSASKGPGDSENNSVVLVLLQSQSVKQDSGVTVDVWVGVLDLWVRFKSMWDDISTVVEQLD